MPADRILAERPRRALEWREVEDGRCVLLRPKFGQGRFSRWLSARVTDPHYRIRLDAVGTFVWKACDGHTPVAQIAERLRDRFGPSVEPVEERLALFVGQMTRSRCLRLTPPDTGS